MYIVFVFKRLVHLSFQEGRKLWNRINPCRIISIVLCVLWTWLLSLNSCKLTSIIARYSHCLVSIKIKLRGIIRIRKKKWPPGNKTASSDKFFKRDKLTSVFHGFSDDPQCRLWISGDIWVVPQQHVCVHTIALPLGKQWQFRIRGSDKQSFVLYGNARSFLEEGIWHLRRSDKTRWWSQCTWILVSGI